MICKIIKTQQQHKPMLKAHILTGVQYFPRSKFLNTFGEYQTKLFSDTPKKKKKGRNKQKTLLRNLGSTQQFSYQTGDYFWLIYNLQKS